MRFATYADGSLDGRLMLVSRDGARAAPAGAIAPSLFEAVRTWARSETPLRALSADLDAGRVAGEPFVATQCLAPLPRAPQWLVGSAFLNHGRLMQQAFRAPPTPHFDTVPVMYQGASDDFLGPHHDSEFVSEEDGIDFEGEFGVVVDEVAMASTPQEAAARIRL